MIICIPVTLDGLVGHGWGRTPRLAVVRVTEGRVADWHELDVHWDKLHDEATPGGHHARVVRFLREHRVDTVVAANMGNGMRNTLNKLGVRVRLGTSGDARTAVAAAASEAAAA